MNDDTIFQQAVELGHEDGRSVGSWVIDGNTSDDERAAIRQGYDDGDPVVMDMCPYPLSGEWGGDSTPDSVLAELDVDPGDDGANDYLDAYEEAFQDGFWEAVLA